MNLILQAATIIVAVTFIGVSATMNAIFLSSLGRTAMEIALLALVSIASDASKAVLPVVMARAVLVRAWLHAAAATAMLLAVTALSLASGTGFAALMRDAIITARSAQGEQLAAVRLELREIDASLAALPVTRSVETIEADLALRRIDRRFLSSRSCAQPITGSDRQFCTDVLRLQAEIAASREREALTARRAAGRHQLERFQSQSGGSEVDPQVRVLSDLLGLAPSLTRVVLTAWTAVILELGALVMALLAAGPGLAGWRDPLTAPSAPVVPAEVPAQPERQHWHRRRNGMTFVSGTDSHGR